MGEKRGIDFDIVQVPERFFALGRRRTAALIAFQASRISFADLVANAYLQGVEDGYTAAERTPTPSPGDAP